VWGLPVKRHILLLHDSVASDAPPDELDTLVQVSQIGQALERLGHTVQARPFAGDLVDLAAFLSGNGFDLVFNLVETFHGSRFLHTIPLLCDRLGFNFTGGNANSLYLTGDKLLAKRLLRLAAIPTPDWIDGNDPSLWSSFIGERLIVKPKDEEASVGIVDDSVFICRTVGELIERREDAHMHHMMVERFIEGREFNISMLSDHGKPRILPIAEMEFIDYPVGKPKIVGYEAKWIEESFAYGHTIRSFASCQNSPELDHKLRDIARSCWHLFDCSGYARVDLRVDSEGDPYVLEVNMNPCIAQDSGFIAACAQEGLSYGQVLEHIVGETMHGNS